MNSLHFRFIPGNSEDVMRLRFSVVDVLESQGLDPLISYRLGMVLEENGFENIDDCVFSLPYGKWGGAVGSLLKEDSKGWADSLKPTVVNLLHISDSEYDEAVAQMMKDADRLDPYVNFFVCCAQKPSK